MRRNQLQELLQEDQEPFHLQDYIHSRRQLFHSRLPKPTSSTLNFTKRLCKKACFFSGGASPDVIESPMIVKRPKNVIFLHVPARTAAMLLEASARIRKAKKMDGPKRLGSFLKKLKQSSGSGEKSKKSEEEEDKVGVLLKDILSLRHGSSTAFMGRSVTLRQNPTFSPEIPDRSLEFETEFCSSPFRFVLHNDSYNHRTPNSSSSADSPSSVEIEIGEQCDRKDKAKLCGNEVEEEEDEEHCSPVSVLDPDPYEEENDIEERYEEDDDDEGSSSFDMNISYANVQRAQERLLEKLSRFERLAELDPLELEIRLKEDEQEDDFSDGFELSEEEGNRKEIESSSNKRALSYIDQLVKEVLNRPEFDTLKRVPAELKRVAKVILTEEELKLIAFDDKSILLERVVRRLVSWQEVAGEIINTMAGHDIAGDFNGWDRKQEQVTDAAMDIELAIFEALVGELCEEL